MVGYNEATEKEIYMNHGASKELAEALSGLFTPLRYVPKSAIEGHDAVALQYKAFAMFIRGHRLKAAGYIERAIFRQMDGWDEPDNITRRKNIIFQKPVQTQRIITNSKNIFDKLRSEQGLQSLETVFG